MNWNYKNEPKNVRETLELYKRLECISSKHLREHLDLEELEIRKFYRKAIRKLKKYWKEK